MSTIDPLIRNNVRVSGAAGAPAILFAHGFGGSGDSWRYVSPAFEADHSVIVFDHASSGAADPAAYDSAKYDSLFAYADDMIEIAKPSNCAT